MTTLTATPLPDLAAVRLEASSATPGDPVLTRTDINGTAPVRLRAGQGMADGTLVVVDYEAALAGLVVYELVHDGRYRASVRLDLDETRLAVAVSPNVSAVVPLVEGLTAGWGSTATLHVVQDRETPVVTTGFLSTRVGQLRMVALEYATAAGIALVYRTGATVLLRQPHHAGLDLYHVVSPGGRVSLDHDEAGAWIVSVDFTEVARPLDPLLGDLGWGFDDVALTFDDFDAVRDSFRDFDELAARGVQLTPQVPTDPDDPDPIPDPPTQTAGVLLVVDETGVWFDVAQPGRRVLYATEAGAVYFDPAGIIGGGYVAVDTTGRPFAELGA